MPSERPATFRSVALGPPWAKTGPVAPDAQVRLDELVERQAARTPDAPAVQDGPATTTYEALVRQARSLAARLREQGVAREDLVAISLDRSADQLASVLGVLLAGAAYVPIDPQGPPERRQFMLADSDPRAIVTTAEGAESIPAPLRPRVVEVPGPIAEAWDPPEERGRPDDLAYVIYTSGSTGRPKGVLNQHDGIANHLAWMAATFPLDTTDRVLAKTSPLFDVSVWEWFWPLTQGACLVVAPTGDEKDPAKLASLIEAHQITNIHFVPTLLRLFLQRPDLDRCRSLQRVFCSGEALPSDLRDRFFERWASRPTLINLYGPTETAVHVTGWICAPGEGGAVPIGYPLPNVRAYIVDAKLDLVAEGVRGELLIGGVQTARSYLRRPELTAERFVPDRFLATPGARCYRTGDCVSWRSDGAIDFHGRFDSQVQLGGLRVELGEIEAALRLHPRVGDAAVVLDRASHGDRLVAYLRREHTSETGRDPSVDSLRALLAERLPTSMLPARYIWLDAFPLTPSGKLDGRALPKPDTAREGLERPFEPPRSGDETRLVRIWEAELKVDRIGRHDDFYLLGGDSLGSIRLVEAMAREFGVELSPHEVWRLPTIAQLAERIQASQTAPHDTSIVVLRQGPGSVAIFLPPSMDGQLFYCRDLVAALGSTRPVYGFRLPSGREGTDLRDVAARFVRDLIAVQPSGPYHLAGYSYSAGVAFEMAQQLRAQGRAVGVLGMIDYGPGEREAGWLTRVRTAGHFVANVPSWLRYDILQSDWTSLWTRTRQKVVNLVPRMRGASSTLDSAARVVDDIYASQRLSESNRRTAVENLRSFFEYQPQPYDGRVLLVRARCSPLLHSLAPTLGWEDYAATFTRIAVACNHDNILKPPHVTLVAAALEAAIDQFT